MRVLPAAAALLACAGATARAQSPAFDILAYRFTIDLPDTGSVIHGTAAIEAARRTALPDTLLLDLLNMDDVQVRSVRPGGAPRFTYDGRRLRVAVPAGRAGEAVRVVVEWRGTPQDGLIIRDNARGARSFFADNWPNRARHWLPTVDHPSDKALVAWEINAPAGMAVVANGRMTGRTALGGGGTRWTFETAQPIPTYTMVLGATAMTVSRHEPLAGAAGRAVPIEVWAYPQDSAFADSVPFRRATAVLATLERIVGPYPYDLLRHVQSSTRYGGMENATVIFYAEQGYVRGRMGEGVVRHETAHQWFGDAVTPADWPHLWLSEGFATYFTGVAAAALDGDSALASHMAAARAAVLRAAVINRPIVDTAERDPNRLLNTNAYQKGAWVLHMLRGEIGDSAFFSGIRAYYRRYRDSSVTTAQFRRVMERASGADLAWFFDQWLYQPGYPQLEIRWGLGTPHGPPTVELQLVQAQPDAWGRYRVALPLVFRFADGTEERRTIALDASSAQYPRIRLRDAPQEVLVDPDGTLLLTATVTRR